MKEMRPSTWITLIVLTALIFVPAFFVDVNSLQQSSGGDVRDNSIKPINPLGGPGPAPGNRPADEPTPNTPPEDKPEGEVTPAD